MSQSLGLKNQQIRYGFTLMELLVAIALSSILLTMAMSILRDLTRSPALQSSDGPASWEQVLREDLRQLVPASRSAVAPVQYLPASDNEPFPVLILQTFSRIGHQPGRGPTQVRYTVMPNTQTGRLDLIRSAQGWHDAHASQQVLVTGVSQWMLSGDLAAALTARSSSQNIQSGIVNVTIQTDDQTQHADFWLRMEPLASPAATETAP